MMTAPDAPEPIGSQPETADARRYLQDFISDFLIPISADGQLDAVEETPLAAAFYAYGVDQVLSRPEVQAQLLDAIRSAAAKESPSPKVLFGYQVQHIWARIQRFPQALSVADLDHLLFWLDRHQNPSAIFAEKSDRQLWMKACQDLKALAAGVTLQEKTQVWRNVCAQCPSFSREDFLFLCREHFYRELGLFRREPLDRRCLEAFYRLLEEARRLLEQQEHAAALAPPPTPAPTVAPVPAAPAAPAVPSAKPPEPAPPQPPPLPPPVCKVREFTCEAAALACLAPPAAYAEKLRATAPALLEFARGLLDHSAPLPFGTALDRPKIVAVRKEADVPPNLWFIGDVHGDLLGLEAILAHIQRVTKEEAAPPPVYVFLGDLIDRLPFSCEVLLRFLALWREAPARVLLLAGNHDDALRWNEKAGAFTASVSPCEFADWLNNRRGDGGLAQIGRVFAELAQRTPRALFLPDGLLAAHGGAPHRDLQEKLKAPEDLDRPECLQDFVWTRLHPRAPRRIPNRSSRTCELGREDFERFCDAASAALGQPVRRMIRGHDHVEERFQLYTSYLRNHVLTINTMCCRQDGEFGEPYPRTPCVARARPGELPEVHRLALPADLVQSYYPPGAE
jgi:hypothetical protein